MNPIDSTIEALIITGAIEVVGIDPATEQPLYKFNQSIQEIMPELYKEHINEVNRDIMRLWEKGFLEIDFMSEDPVVTLTDKAFIDEEIEKISRELQISLLEIKRLLLK
jgi:hypothetical protein